MGGGDGLAQALVDLQELAERLRRDCPWDRAQTERTIVPHTVEEAYEVADAALGGDDAKLLDELGDLLFQTVFLALLLEERGAGDLAAAARGIHDKLVRRHPHVFGDAELATPGAVKGRWEELKREQEEREGIFHHVPETLPALLEQEREEVDLEEQVAELVEKLRRIVAERGVCDLVRLLDGVGDDRARCLLAVPGAVAAQSPGQLLEVEKRLREWHPEDVTGSRSRWAPAVPEARSRSRS